MPRHRLSIILYCAAVLIVLAVIAVAVPVVLDGELVLGSLSIRWQAGASMPLPFTAEQVPIEPSRRPSAWTVDGERPRNVVIVIGDGMGVGAVSVASALVRGVEGGLAVESAPVAGLMRTWSASDLVTDSAASATALATGFKTLNRRLGRLPDGRDVRTLMEAARDAGMRTGVVTTSGLIDATPAGFTTHALHRRRYSEIFQGMVASGVDVMLGGDWADKESWDENELGPEAIVEQARSAGYAVVRNQNDLASVSGGRVLGLFPPRTRGGDHYGPPLAVTACRALELLESDDAFVVMIESEVTDETAHDNDISALMDGMRELDEAVQVVLELAARRGDTLVVVIADHDTGGLGIDLARYGKGRARVRWATGDHTNQWVPVFAFGPGCDRFGAVLDNTDVARILGELLELPDFPKVLEHGP